MLRPGSFGSTTETFILGPFVVPRIWVGLWQLSSNAWGSAPAARIRQGMSRHAELGYNAFGTSASSSLSARANRYSCQTWCGIPTIHFFAFSYTDPFAFCLHGFLKGKF